MSRWMSRSIRGPRRWVHKCPFMVHQINMLPKELCSPTLKSTFIFLSLRASAFGVLNALCKLAAVLSSSVFSNFVGTTNAVPILLSFTALVCGGLVALKLPDTRDKILQWRHSSRMGERLAKTLRLLRKKQLNFFFLFFFFSQRLKWKSLHEKMTELSLFRCCRCCCCFKPCSCWAGTKERDGVPFLM